jgi:SAM-dependent methyltransferase
MSFEASAEVYDRHVGRYGSALADALIGFARIQGGDRVLDVGCGPGPLTAALARRLGAENVTAVDPSASFVAACAARVPGARVERASAEALPVADGDFDAVLSQLVVNFLADPEQGLREMTRVTRSGGVVAGCVWDYGGAMTMLRAFWDAAKALDPFAADEGAVMRFGTPDELGELWRGAGLEQVTVTPLVVEAAYRDFGDLWAPFTTGVGPAGAYATSLDAQAQEELRDEFARRLGDPRGPFTLSARAWCAVGSTS